MEKIYAYILSQIPDTIDFDFISVKNETTKSIYLDNISEQSLLFEIENADGYIFDPSNGIIPKKKKIEIKIKRLPNLANVLVGNARIVLDQKYKKIIRMSSIAKYPYLNLNKSNIDFGIVQIGHTTEQELIIYNQENVPAYFNIERTSTQPGKQPCMFFISNLTGFIPPKSNYLIKILFKPMFPLTNSYETFLLSTKGGNKLMFSCSGSCKPLKTWVGTKVVNFKTVPLGSQMKKLFRIYNDSDLPTEFQIYHDNSGSFFFDINQGIVPGKSNIRVNVTFRPYETIVYYQRVFCIIRNHSLFPIDMFGSCHNLLIKSPLLDTKQIEMFRYKELKGLFFNRNKNNNSKKLELFDQLNKSESIVSEIGNNNNNNNDNNNGLNFDNVKINSMIPGQQPQLHKEMFWETYSETRLISFSTDLVDFNYIQSGTVSDPYPLTVNNNSNEDMKVKFIFEKPINLNNLIKSVNIFNAENTVFFTQPEEQVIPKFSSATFKIYFKPNKSEYYFYTDLPCQSTIISKKDFLNTFAGNTNRNAKQLHDINKNRLSDFGKEIATQSIDFNNTSQIFKYNTNAKKNLMGIGIIDNQKEENKNLAKLKQSNLEPPITLCLSIVGHSFPPGTQIFIPIYELNPKKEMFFPPTTINQSLYQTLKIENKNDTPLFYKISPDTNGIFRVHCKYGLIPIHSFHLICIEFCPKDTTVYRFPLRITFNHDAQNMKTIMINGLCTDPVIDLEGISNEMYFPPSYVGIKTKKSVMIKNISPIKILVNIKITNMENGILEVDEDSFEMDINLVKKIDFYLTPIKMDEINAHVVITAERVYDPTNENVGIYNPTCGNDTKGDHKESDFDRRIFKKEFNVLGRGSDGDIRIEPQKLEFGTVKVGFHKKMSFSIYNPTITNFYIKIEPDFYGNIMLTEDKNNKEHNKKRSDISFDFTEGLLNSFCKKDISIQFEPTTRVNLCFKVNVYATDNTVKNGKLNIEEAKNPDLEEPEELSIEHKEDLKCALEVKAKGDYPLIKIVDIRNNLTSSSKLWKDFNVDLANEELQKKLTSEEINYSNSKTNKKIDDVTHKLKLIKFDFGKHFFKRDKIDQQHYDIFLTLKNEGGVLSEFYFKFPDDVNIKREIWMDPVEPTSNDKVEYHVLKEQIFTIEPRQSKLEPGKTCNIRIRYNIKEKGLHRLRVIFQIVSGKPLIFELFSETLTDRSGILLLPKKVIDFDYVPIGYKNFISSPIELNNISAIKLRYALDNEQIEKYNKVHENFDIFKVDNCEGTIGPGETKYIIAYFRPLTAITYKLPLELLYNDDLKSYSQQILITGKGYHPLKFTPPIRLSPYIGMPNEMICNIYKNEMVKKCWLNIEELDFGSITEPKNKTFILYNLSNKESFNFDFVDPGFLIKDQFEIQPNKGTLEPGEHKIIKCILTPNTSQNCEYEGDITIKISWNKSIAYGASILPKSMAFSKKNLVKITGVSQQGNALINSNVGMNKGNTIERENLNIRVVKKSILKESIGSLSQDINSNCCFIETIIKNLTKKILCSEEFKQSFIKNIENQPLSLYKWTNNEVLPSLGEIRQKYLLHLKKLTPQIGEQQERENRANKRGKNIADFKSLGNKSSYSLLHTKREALGSVKDQNSEVPTIKEEFTEEMDSEIQEKYIRDLLLKYKYTLNEINEKIIVSNDETKKLISDIIMENTIYNIICEAVYGNLDLINKPKIYFFLNKGNITINPAQGAVINANANNENTNDKNETGDKNSNANDNKEADENKNENKEKDSNQNEKKDEEENVDNKDNKDNKNVKNNFDINNNAIPENENE